MITATLMVLGMKLGLGVGGGVFEHAPRNNGSVAEMQVLAAIMDWVLTGHNLVPSVDERHVE